MGCLKFIDQRLYVFLIFGLLNFFNGFGQTSPINETFSNLGPYGGYQTETWTGDDGGTWTATDARTDRTINGDAIMVRDGELTSPTVSGGIGDLTVTTQRQFSGGSGNMGLRVNGTSVGSIPYDGTVQTTTISGINISGNVIVVIDATNSSSDRVVIDDLQWTAFSGTTPTVGFDATTSTENETNATFNVSIPVTLSNYSADVDLSVAINGSSTAESADYTLNTTSLSFTGNGTQNISLDINDDADADDETIILDIAETTSTGITISPDQHTLTVVDDDLPSATIPYNDDFSNCNTSNANWSIATVGAETEWSCGSGYFEANAFGSSGAADDYLVSPSFDMDAQTGETLTFTSWTRFQDVSSPQIELLYTDNFTGDPATTTWNSSLNPTWPDPDSQTNTGSGNVDVSGITGTAVHFAFRYTSTGTGSGTTEAWRIEDFDISTASTPTITLSETSLSGLDYVDGSGPSAEQTFTAEGSDLTNDIVLTAPADFEISTTSGSGFGSTVTLSESGGSVSTTDIYVRLASGLAVNTYSGTLTATSTGATQQDISLTGSVFTPIFEDFNDGEFTSNPIWTGSTSSFSVISNSVIPNGNASTDSSYLASDSSEGQISLAVQSSEVSEWQFSLATPSYNPSNSNNFGVVLMSNASFSGDLASNNFQGYFIKIGTNGGTDPIELWRKTGAGETKVGDFPLSPSFGIGALRDGLNLRITRSPSGQFELFYNTGFEYLSQPTTSAGSLTDNTYSLSSYFGIFQNFNNSSASRRVYFDNIDLGDATLDDDSEVNSPTAQVPGGTITADVATNVTNAVEVFKFDIEDLGTSDATATEFTQFRLVPGDDNTALWSQVIQGIRVVAEGTGGVVAQGDQNLTINDNEIIVEVTDTPQDETTIDDGTTREYTISVFLNTSGITDQEVIQFAIPNSTTNWVTAPGSSQFTSPFTGFEGNPFTIDVVGQTYAYISQPVNANVNLAMSTDVQIAYVDSNNNIDLAFTDSVEITSSGTLQTTALTAIPVDGIATFMGSAIIHTVAENNVVLSATSTASGFPTPLESDPFDIIIAPELFISEVTDPGDDSSAKYVEVFNAGVTAIDFSSTEFFLTREANAGNSYEINQLSGVLPAKGYYIVSNQTPSEFATTYNGATTNLDAFALGNGNDAYILSTSGSNSSEAINTQFDVYGQIGINGFTNDSSTDSNNSSTTDDAEWEYEDSRAYRLSPDVKFANTIWTTSEWVVDTDGANTPDMTPGYGDQDYIYDGDWTSIGLGNPIGMSSGSENIFVRSGSVTISVDTSIGDLVVRSGATLSLSPNVKLTVTGDIVNEGLIIFESDDTGSAVLEPVATNTRIVGDGFEIQRYIPDSNRAFRYLAPSVSTNNSAKTSINANWQEGVNNTSQLDADNQDPNPGFGTHITGSSIGANGFDATSTGNPSMFEWNASTQAWEAIPNTDNNTFFAGDAYAILIRGDRSTTLNSNTALGNPTVLRATGKIQFGDYSVDETDLSPADNSNGVFSLVGNPYQSQVDLKDLLENHSMDINNNVAYIYDPTLGDVGGYATIDLEDLSFSSIPLGTSANQYLQPNQAFFVESNGNLPSITFEESVKNNTDNQFGTFSDSQNTLPTHININLRDDNSQLIDGVRIVYANSYSSTINQNDAKKAWNFNESLTVYSENTNLSIEKRNLPTALDTTQIQIFNYTKSEYSLSLDFQPNAQTNIEMYLYDQYTQSLVEILANQITAYNFTVDQSIPETTSPQRFLILYEEATLGVGDYLENNFIVFPNPMPSNQLYIEGVEENIEGINRVELFNIQGQKIVSFSGENIDLVGKRIRLQFDRKVSKGTYLLHIIASEKKYIRKLIIN